MNSLRKFAAGLLLTGAALLTTGLNADAQRGGAHASGGGGVAVGRGGGGGFGGGGISLGRGGFGGGYRSGVSLGLGLGYGYGWGRPAYGFYGYPRIGFYMSTLPYGYYPFYMGADQYYYANGAFYRPYEDGYVVTTPPVGASVPKLPRGAKPIKIDGKEFYEFGGVYYQPVVNDEGKTIYVVAGKDGTLNTNSINLPQVGEVVLEVPSGSRRIKLNGEEYFVSPEGVYYVAIYDEKGNPAYRVASVEDDERED